MSWLKARLGNLGNDVTELEGLLAAVLSVSGVATTLAAGNSQAQHVVGVVLAGVGTLSLVLKKVADSLGTPS